MKNSLHKVGVFQQTYNNKLGVSLPLFDIYQDDGLLIHIQQRHPNCVKYLSQIQNILKAPDYIGSNPKEPNSIELIKNIGDNIQIAIKLDSSNGYYYIATLHEVSNVKINARLNNGRLKKF